MMELMVADNSSCQQLQSDPLCCNCRSLNWTAAPLTSESMIKTMKFSPVLVVFNVLHCCSGSVNSGGEVRVLRRRYSTRTVTGRLLVLLQLVSFTSVIVTSTATITSSANTAVPVLWKSQSSNSITNLERMTKRVEAGLSIIPSYWL